MKSTIIESSPRVPTKFPCLMATKNNNLVIIATGTSEGNLVGTIVGGHSPSYELGHYTSSWAMAQFTAFEATVSLVGYEEGGVNVNGSLT